MLTTGRRQRQQKTGLVNKASPGNTWWDRERQIGTTTPNRNEQIRNTGAVRNGNEGAITFRSSPGNAVNIEPHRTCFRALPSKLWRHPRADRDNRPDTRQHGQPGRGGPQKPEGPHTPAQHGTLYAHLRAPASDFRRPAAPPKDLPGALEAPMAARLRGKRRAARIRVARARQEGNTSMASPGSSMPDEDAGCTVKQGAP